MKVAAENNRGPKRNLRALVTESALGELSGKEQQAPEQGDEKNRESREKEFRPSRGKEGDRCKPFASAKRRPILAGGVLERNQKEKESQETSGIGKDKLEGRA